MANKIYVRSPWIVSITGTVGGTTKCELYITTTGMFPTLPTYTLSKPVASTTNLLTQYNISEFVREFISMNTIERPFDSFVAVPANNYCRVRVRRYVNNVLSGVTDYDAYDGYGYYEDGGNPSLSSVHLTPGSYQYFQGGDPGVETIYRAQWIRIIPDSNWEVRYTSLTSGVTIVEPLTDDLRVIVPAVYESFLPVGNIVTVLDGSNVVQFTGTFRPVNECRYTPSVVEFVNRFGSWQRQHFFKVTDRSINIKQSDYNLYQSSIPSYSTAQGQKRQFNKNGKDRLILNSGIVNDDFFNVVQEMALSERILIDGLPYKISSESIKRLTENVSKINNYTIEFEANYNKINNVT